MKPEVTVVIPSLKPRDDIITIDSVPSDIPILIQQEDSSSKARNSGIANADTDLVLCLDDDIIFDENTFWNIARSLEQGRLVGLEDYEYCWVISRLFGLHREDWKQVGGFDERLKSYNEDTDLAIKYEKAGLDILRLPRDTVEHVDHDRSINKWDRAWRGVYLAAKHPRYAPELFRGLVLR